MTFKHLRVCELPNIELEAVDGKHYYLCDNQAYPSVTTVLDKTADKYALGNWRRRVGAEVADYIKDSASAVGTEAHRFNEAYLNNIAPYYGNPTRTRCMAWPIMTTCDHTLTT